MAAKDSNINHGSKSEGRTGTLNLEVYQVTPAFRIPHNLAKDIIEDVVRTANLKSSFGSVEK